MLHPPCLLPLLLAVSASTVLTTLSALLVKVPPFDQRQSLRCASLTLEQVQPFKTLRVAGGKKKAAASRKGGCSKARGKRKREEEEEEEEEWELEDEEEEEEEERPAGRKGRGKRKAVEQEDDDGQQQEDEVEGGQARVATAPPNLYMPEDPTVSVMCGQGGLCHEHEGECWRQVSLADHLCLSSTLLLHSHASPYSCPLC